MSAPEALSTIWVPKLFGLRIHGLMYDGARGPRRIEHPHTVTMHQNLALRSVHEIRLGWLIAVVLLLASGTFAQVPVASPSPSPSPTPEGRPLYGLQGVLIETLDGKVVASQAENDQFNPASTMKLATALVALKTLGPDH